MGHKKKPYIPKKKSAPSPLTGKTYVGKLEVTRHGKGYVIVEQLPEDILVYPENMHLGLDGDTVRVKILKANSKGKLEGEVTEVVTHAQVEFIGRLDVSDKFAFLLPDNEKIKIDIFVPLHELAGAKDGEKVVVQVTEWHGKSKNPAGKVVEILSNERQNEIAMKEILVENGFPLRFSEAAISEAEALPDTLDPQEIKRRKDCRNVLTFTIDPVDAKDFDDALSIRHLPNGHIEVGVHIADVSHYLRPGTVLDQEAYERATSVYLPDRVLPMLPERISNVLCSLRPQEDKFSFSVIFQLNRKGTVKHYWIGRTVIHSDRRFTYEEAQQRIEGQGGELSEEILLLDEIAKNLRRTRFKNGAINFSSQEVRFQLDENGKPVGVVVKESKEANKLIEEFMLLANRTVAAHIGKKKVKGQPIPFPYRVHDFPDEDKLAVFASFASRFGHKFNLNNKDEIANSFNDMLKLVKGKPEQHVLEQLGIRTMAKAIYTSENIGHYGLGFKDYCHFTSPIRRYPDVMVHRIVQEVLDNEVVPDKKMEIKSRHSSDRERKAMEAERAANKYKQVEFMQDYVGEVFDAVVSGVSSFGFWAETVAHKCEGLVPLSELAALDEFHFLDTEYALIGLRTGLRFRIGDAVRVRVLATNLEKRQIDFGYEPVASGKREAEKKAESPAKRKASPSSSSKGKNGTGQVARGGAKATGGKATKAGRGKKQ